MLNHYREGEVVEEITTVGIDLAKNVFSVHAVGSQGEVVVRRALSLAKQTALSLLLVRQVFVQELTSRLNRLRGLLTEFGNVLPLRASEVHRRVPQLLAKLPS